GLVDAGDAADGLERDLRDRRLPVDVAQLAARARADRLGLVPAAAEDAAQRHREARGLGGGDELLGVRPLAVLETALERVVRGVEVVADRDGPGALLEAALPLGAAVACRHVAPLARRCADS